MLLAWQGSSVSLSQILHIQTYRAVAPTPPPQPHQLAGAGLNPDKLGVAAALWDGALVLAGYLAAQPAYKYLGE